MDVRLASTINPALKRVEQVSQETAPVLGHLLMPVSLIGYVFAAWRVLADLGWVGEFFIERGLFSHWQVWVAFGIAVQMLASTLNRIGRSSNDSVAP